MKLFIRLFVGYTLLQQCLHSKRLILKLITLFPTQIFPKRIDFLHTHQKTSTIRNPISNFIPHTVTVTPTKYLFKRDAFTGCISEHRMNSTLGLRMFLVSVVPVVAAGSFSNTCSISMPKKYKQANTFLIKFKF